MPEVTMTVVFKSSDKDVKNYLENLNGILSKDTLLNLAKIFQQESLDESIFERFDNDEIDSSTTVTFEKKIKDLYRIYIFGDACQEFLDLISDVDNCIYWAFMSHEYGYDTYSLNDGNGYWSQSVYWEGGSDPEEDKKEAELEWYSTMTKQVMKEFVDENIESIYEKVKLYKSKPKEIDPWVIFLTNHVDKDGLILKLRIKTKKKRISLLRQLKPYVKNPCDKEFEKLVLFFKNARSKCFEEPDDVRYPNWSRNRKAPEQLAKGMMFVEVSGNYLYVGFQMNENIRPYVDGELNVCAGGTYVTNMAEYFEIFSDGVSGRAVHRAGQQFIINDIIYHGGFFYVE